jgi:hypothetical protein
MQRKALTQTSQDEDLPPIDKLAKYLGSLQSCLRLGHVSLLVYSRTLGTQTSLRSTGANPFMPCPAEGVPSYSVAHQVAEIVLEDPDEKTNRFSAASNLPQDLAAIATEQVRVLLRQALFKYYECQPRFNCGLMLCVRHG